MSANVVRKNGTFILPSGSADDKSSWSLNADRPSKCAGPSSNGTSDGTVWTNQPLSIYLPRAGRNRGPGARHLGLNNCIHRPRLLDEQMVSPVS